MTMVFKKLMALVGVGGPEVETIPYNDSVRPGEALQGEIHLQGGEQPAEIQSVHIGLATQVENEAGDYEYRTTEEFARAAVIGPFQLDSGARHSLPFSLPIPWETPLTHLGGAPMRGMTVGLQTHLAVARAVDATDLDPVAVHPLPAQEQILSAFEALGFRFTSADNERGRIRRARQSLPFYQEIEFSPPRRFAGAIKQLEVTFVAGPHSLELVLELDKRGGLFTEGRDEFGRFTVDYASAAQTDWPRQLDGWLQQACQRRGLFF